MATVHDTLQRDPVSGLITGLQYDVFASGPNLLADFDFSTPSIVGIDGNGTFASTYATEEFFDFSAATVPNNVGTETLTNNGGLLNRSKNGLYNGTSYAPAGGWEAIDSSDILSASGTSAGECDGVDIAVRMVVRYTRAPGSFDLLMSKQMSAFPSTGWYLGVKGGDPNELSFNIDSGSVTKTVSTSGNAAALSGVWFVVDAFYDFSADLLYIKTSLTGETSISSAGIGPSLANTGPLTINSTAAKTTGLGTLGMQVAYAGISVGANAQNFYDQVCVMPGADPTGLLTTISRNCMISVPVSATEVAHFAPNTLPIGYNANFSAGYGLCCNSAVTNLVSYSRLSTGATGSTTNTDNAADAADGFRAASTHTATGAADFIGKSVSVTAATAYCGSVYISESTVGVSGRVYAYDASNLAEIAGAVAFTADATWGQDIQVPFTTPAGCTSVELRVEITTSGQTVKTDFWQVNLGSARGAIINTSAAAAALVTPTYKAVGSAGQYCKAAAGEIELVYLVSVPKTGNIRYLSASDGASDQNYRQMWGAGAIQNRFWAHDSSGTAIAPAAESTSAFESETTVVGQWDDSGGLSAAAGADVALTVNGGTTLTDIGTFVSTETITDVLLGNYRSPASAYALDGFIQRVRIWDGERAA